MRKNLYTKTLDEIKISENAVDTAVEKLYGKQKSDNVIDINKLKKKTANKIVAASLVAAMFISGGALALLSQPAKSSQNGFVITAAAAELSKNKPVELAKVGSAHNLHFCFKSYKEKFNLTLSCKGDNISSITYTANGNSYLVVDSLYDDNIFDIKKYADTKKYENYTDYPEVLWYNEDKMYSSFTVDYNKQFADKQVEDYEESPLSMNVFLTAKDGEKADEVLKKHDIYFTFSDDAIVKNTNPRKYYTEKIGDNFDKGLNLETYQKSDLIEMYNELYSQLFDGISVDVTVKYNDGTEETQTVDFSVEPITEENADEYLEKNGYDGTNSSLLTLICSVPMITATLK